MENEVFILSSARTPIGSFGGALSGIQACQLGAVAINAALMRSGISDKEVDELYMGNVLSANLGQAPARQAAVFANLPRKVICTTINKVCASGMKAVMLGTQSIKLGDARVVIAGGMENMSQVPFYLAKARNGYGYGNGELTDGLVKDGLTDAYGQMAMGVCADRTAERYVISRAEQDAYAIQSYQLVADSTEKGYFENEIVPVEITDRKTKSTFLFDQDEEYKKVKFEKIPHLRPAFTKEGTVTAANASNINDGSAALVLANGEIVKNYGLKPLAKIIAYADAAQEPEWFTTAPILATRKVLAKAGLTLNDIDFFEINEAFSVVVLAYMKELQLDRDQVNALGGGVALGHPLGASGARIIATLLSVLSVKKGKYGLATICNGGGGASAIIVERL